MYQEPTQYYIKKFRKRIFAIKRKNKSFPWIQTNLKFKQTITTNADN